uniref:armadillo repeat-containing protein 8 isoform X2 n=1 Tax=Fragaria vesca subsp. vesca TaxID=101020 RepID=UPI0005CA64CA|nr:PREDICTED: armadillo repeat-containing protein 8 isoform X2 [Fragaria vesca subsp. vesca]
MDFLFHTLQFSPSHRFFCPLSHSYSPELISSPLLHETMPASASASSTTATATATATVTAPNSDLLTRLSSPDSQVQLKALRELKNRIIGNRTKKLAFVKLGLVPAVAAILASTAQAHTRPDHDSNLLVQSAAALGSFACGFDAGVRAVLDAGACPNLLLLLSHPDDKVVDAGARSLRMIYQSNLAPKCDFLQDKNMEFLLSLLNSENENVNGLGASIIIHSCETMAEKKALCQAGVLKKLVSLLEGSPSQRDNSLESLATIMKNNDEAVSEFADCESGRALSSVIELTKDRNPRTRFLASTCLITIRNTSSCYLQDIGIKTKLVHLLLELHDDPGQVGDEAPFAFSSLISQKVDLQKLALEANAIDKLYNHLQKNHLHPKRFEGLLLALADLCSKLESCRSRFLSLQALNLVSEALIHDSSDVRTAACICLRCVSRSIKNLCAGNFMNEMIVPPLVRLLDDPSTSVQVAALSAVGNIVVDFTTHRSLFLQCGGVKQLVQLSRSMDSTLRLNALWALRNLMCLADYMCKQEIFMELTASSLASLISDPEPFVQEQALALVRNLVDGCMKSVELAFAEDGIILDAVGRQLQGASRDEIRIQGLYVLSNVASGIEVHKEAVMHQLVPEVDNGAQSLILKFLQSNESQLRIAAVWTIVNLTFPSSPDAFSRFIKLHNAGIVSQVKSMINDPCLDVKLRVRSALGQFTTFSDGSCLPLN